VALRAGVSTDYYVRLEQGRDQHPSPQVLDALARALQLDEDVTAHLHRRANAPMSQRRKRARREKVPAAIAQIIQLWSETPAFVEGRYTDVLAVNSLATALAPYYTVGTHLVRATFLDPRVREMCDDWEEITHSAVAALRALVGAEVDDPRLNDLVGDPSIRCERFRQLWARHDARPKRSGITDSSIPVIGPLELSYEKLPIPDTDGQTLACTTRSPVARAHAHSLCWRVQRWGGRRFGTSRARRAGVQTLPRCELRSPLVRRRSSTP
jgi:transcriptional regulator with XRE-family HTH domain